MIVARDKALAMTGSSLLTLLVLAATAALSPFSLVVFSLVLATDRGPRNGLAFILGWIVTVVLIGSVMLAFGSVIHVPTNSAPRKWFLALQLALGTVLILIWMRRRFRPRPDRPSAPKPEAPMPGWQRRIATMGYLGAFVLGGLTQTWPAMIAAGAEISKLDVPVAEAVGWVVLFALATTAGIDVLEVLAMRSPGTAAERLDRIRDYVEHHRDSVINWLVLFAGLFLVYRALIGIL
jgi:threonine/homoserine/homoserine lactone efflux protein